MSKLAIHGGDPVLPEPYPLPTPFGEEERIALSTAMESGIASWAGTGAFVRQFETEFAKYHDIPFAISTTSGTTALHTAVTALGIEEGDEVLVPALTFVSTASVVLQEGGIPVFVDVDGETFNICIKDAKKKFSNRTKGIIAVHLYGCAADMSEIVNFAKEKGLWLLEDCAQAHGAKYSNRLVGTFGDASCFSFFQTKNLSCGEGGMILTASKEIASKCRIIKDHGREQSVRRTPDATDSHTKAYDYTRLGYNYHMSELHASIGCAQLAKLSANNIERRRIADRYRILLSGSELYFQRIQQGIEPAPNALTALLPDRLAVSRDWFIDAVTAENVKIEAFYPSPLHQAALFERPGSHHLCPNAESVSKRLFNMFVWPGTTDGQVEAVVKAILKVKSYLDE